MAVLLDDAGQNPRLDDADIPFVDGSPFQPRKQIDPDPVAVENRIGIPNGTKNTR